jgi:hypothetical protein
MVPASFDQSNDVLGKPSDMTHDECDCLSVYRGPDSDGRPVVVSCWKLTAEEQEELLRTGRLWLTVAGTTMPPVVLSGRCPFLEDSAAADF